MEEKKQTRQKDKIEHNAEENILRELGRIIGGGYYDFQEMRISSFNRIRDIVRRKIEDIPTEQPESKKDSKEYEKYYQDSMLDDGIDYIFQHGLITESEHRYIKRTLKLALESKSLEKKYERAMSDYIDTEPVWQEFLSKVAGIGKVLTTNLLKEYGDCSRFEYVSSMWKYSGQHVTDDGKAPQKRKGQDLDYSPRLRTLVWKVSDCLMKNNFQTVQQNGAKVRLPLFYRQVYDREKEKELQREYPEGYLAENFNGYKKDDTQVSKGHAHNRALRKMRKIFMEHYWVASRELSGQEVTKPYQFEDQVGGKVHKKYVHWREIVD